MCNAEHSSPRFSVVKASVFTYDSQKWGGRHMTACLCGPLGPYPCPSPSSLYSWSRAALNRLKLCFCLRWGNFPEPTLLSCPYIQGTAEGVVPATRNQYVCQSPGDGAPAALLIHRVLWGAAPQPSGLQWTLHVSSALLKVWGERVDRLGKASSVTRPGPLQCAPTPAFPGARPTHRSCITTTSSLSGKSCTQP